MTPLRNASAPLIGYGVAVAIILAALRALGMGWSEAPKVLAIVAGGFALTTLLFAVAAGGIRSHRPLLGLSTGLVASVCLGLLLEGFEQGLLPLVSDPLWWVWLAGLGAGGSALGWAWSASANQSAP